MKRIIKYFISFLMIFSLFIPFMPNKVEALGKTYTYAYIDATDLGPRACPSYDCSRTYHDEGGIIWLDRPRVVEVIDYSGSWAKIRWNYWGFTYEGWVLQEYLGNKQTFTLDSDYMDSLRSKGFPESYVEKLTKMHMIHPNWNFVPQKVNITLDDAVAGEYNPIYKNLISTTNTAQLATDGGAYSNGSYTQFEPGWYAPSRDTLKYYIDPRNFLDDNQIFMFEQLSNDNSITEEQIQKLLDGTFMAGSFMYNNTEYTYAKAIIDAGKNNNVSAVHLATRILQEQGLNGSATSGMIASDGKTYYNYFNFNASGSTTEEIINGALRYAIASGWDNPYKAINGAAADLSDGYINNGQDTLYYQKFNVVGGSQFWHQYMANIQAPYSESYRTYSSYWNSGLINNSFTFKIPVYNNMEPQTVIATKSNNNNLNSLTFNTGTIYPAFDSSITTYSLLVEYDVTSVEVSGVLADNKASVTGLGKITLTENTTVSYIKVTAEDGSVKTYTINILKKDAPSDVTSTTSPYSVVTESGYSISNNNVSGFEIGQDVKKVVEKINKTNSSSIVKIYDTDGNEIKSGLIATGQRIEVTTDKTSNYYVVVHGDINGDGKISAIDYSRVKAYILKKYVLNGAYLQAADNSGDGVISAIDYSRIKAHILNKYTLQQ